MVREANLKVYKRVHNKLNLREGEKYLYRIAKKRQAFKKNLSIVKFVQDKQDILMQDD